MDKSHQIAAVAAIMKIRDTRSEQLENEQGFIELNARNVAEKVLTEITNHSSSAQAPELIRMARLTADNQELWKSYSEERISGFASKLLSGFDDFEEKILKKKCTAHIMAQSGEEMLSGYHALAQSMRTFGMLEIIEAGFVPDWKRLLAVRMSSEFHKEGGADISDFLSAEQMALLVKLWSRKCGVNWHLGICVKKSWDEHDYELQLCPPDPSGTIIWICDKRDDRRVNRKPRRQGAPIWAGYRCFPRGDEFIKATKRDFEQLEADELLGAGKSSGYLIKEGPKEIAGGGGN